MSPPLGESREIPCVAAQSSHFFTLFAFALGNEEPVLLHLFFGTTWEAPLVLVLLCAVLLGMLLGILVMTPHWWRARRSAKKVQTAPTEAPTTPPSDDSNVHGI